MNSSLEITAAAEETKLATLERVKAELDITSDEFDGLLSAKLDEASSDIQLRVDPTLRRETVIETLRPGFMPGGGVECVQATALRLRRRPIVSIDTISLDGIELGTGEYYHGDDAEHWNGDLFRLSSGGSPMRWQFLQAAVVTYTAGYLLPGQENRNLPPSLEAAAIELVTSYWSSRGRDPNLRAEENVGVARFEYWVGAVGEYGELPPGVMSKIAPFRAGGFA